MALTFEQFISQLLEPGTRLATAELRILSSLTPGQLSILAQAWPRISLQRRRKLVNLMAELAEENVDLDYNDTFRLALTDADEEVRRQAAEALWEDETFATADALVQALLHDVAPVVRAAAAVSLGHFVALIELEKFERKTGAHIEDALFQAVNNQNEPTEVRRRAVESVGYLSADRARTAIAEAYADKNLQMKGSAIFAMGRSADRRWLPAILAELQSSDTELRFEAARASGEFEDQRAVPLLLKLLTDPDREVKMAVIGSLGQIGGPQARQALQHLLQSTDQEIASAADEALELMDVMDNPLNVHMPEFGGE